MVRLDEIFEIKNGNSLELLNCEEIENGMPFISRTSANNGMVARIKQNDYVDPMEPFCITVALGGSVLSSFLQTEPFYTSFHIFCLYPKIKLSEAEMIFYCAAIEKNKYRYSYGRQANKTLKNIKVPSPDEIPQEIKNYKAGVDTVFVQKPLNKNKMELKTENWKWFLYDEIFEIEKGFYNKKPEESEDGEVVFIGATEFNNGITSYHKEYDVEKIYDGNCLTVSNNGSVGNAFYQSQEFTCTHDVNVLRLKDFKMNAFVALFLSTLIEKEKYRWAYGRKWRPKRMPSSKIKLPVFANGKPDWQFMEDYIKSLPYSANL